MSIDTHFHFLPKEYIDMLSGKDKSYLNENLTEKNGIKHIVMASGFSYPLYPGFCDINETIKDMDKMKLDQAMLSISPTIFHYDKEVSLAVELNQMLNNSIYQTSKDNPNKFIPMGSLPMQDIDEAIKELKRLVSLGFKAIQIGSNVQGIQFDDPKFLPFFEECNAKNIIILLHPYYGLAKELFSKYYLMNLYGFPLEGAMACASIMFGGLLDKYPNLKFILCHGGGFFPYLFGRITHGYNVRQEPKINNIGLPDKYLKNFYFDTMVYEQKQLKFLVDFAGADHVVIGTDYGFDMAYEKPVDFVNSSSLSKEEKEMILSKNVTELLNQ